MAQSFTPSKPLAVAPKPRRRVLVTGAAGHIGSYFAEHSHRRYELRLMVQEMDEDAKKIAKYGEVVQGELSDTATLTELCRGIDTVLHLAASAGPSSGPSSERSASAAPHSWV